MSVAQFRSSIGNWAELRILNLYAGIGGNRKLWDGDIVAVEQNADVAAIYQEFFPDDQVIVGDAHEYLREEMDNFDFIWSSPPCQSHSRMVRLSDKRRYPDMRLYEEIVLLKEYARCNWVVENVEPYYRPLIHGEKRGRHYFWSNRYIPEFNVREFPGSFVKASLQELADWLDMPVRKVYLDTHCPAQVYRNCVHPELGKEIFECVNV